MIIFLYGEDDFSAKIKLTELKNRFLKEVDKTGGSLDWIDGEKATLREINEKSSGGSLLAPKRMVVIENIFRAKDKELLPEVTKYFKDKEKSGNDNIIIFLENYLKTKSKYNSTETVKMDAEGREKPLTKAEKELFVFLSGVKIKQEFKKLNNLDLTAWIKKEFSARGGQASLKAINALIVATAGDMWQLDKEINKLVNYKNGQMPAEIPLLSPRTQLFCGAGKEGSGVVFGEVKADDNNPPCPAENPPRPSTDTPEISGFKNPPRRGIVHSRGLGIKNPPQEGNRPLSQEGNYLQRGEILEINEKDVEELVRGAFEENIFALTDAIAGKNKSLAVKCLEEEIKNGANEIYILSMIVRQVRIVLQVRQALDLGKNPRQIATDLKLNFFVVNKAATQARNFTLDFLKKLLNQLVEIDCKAKTGQGDPLTLLNLFISRL